MQREFAEALTLKAVFEADAGVRVKLLEHLLKASWSTSVSKLVSFFNSHGMHLHRNIIEVSFLISDQTQAADEFLRLIAPQVQAHLMVEACLSAGLPGAAQVLADRLPSRRLSEPSPNQLFTQAGDWELQMDSSAEIDVHQLQLQGVRVKRGQRLHDSLVLVVEATPTQVERLRSTLHGLQRVHRL
jgi:hypothetical protein